MWKRVYIVVGLKIILCVCVCTRKKGQRKWKSIVCEEFFFYVLFLFAKEKHAHENCRLKDFSQCIWNRVTSVKLRCEVTCLWEWMKKKKVDTIRPVALNKKMCFVMCKKCYVCVKNVCRANLETTTTKMKIIISMPRPNLFGKALICIRHWIYLRDRWLCVRDKGFGKMPATCLMLYTYIYIFFSLEVKPSRIQQHHHHHHHRCRRHPRCRRRLHRRPTILLCVCVWKSVFISW